MGNCSECKKDNFCGKCDELVNQGKKFTANLDEINRQARNEFGHTLQKYITI